MKGFGRRSERPLSFSAEGRRRPPPSPVARQVALAVLGLVVGAAAGSIGALVITERTPSGTPVRQDSSAVEMAGRKAAPALDRDGGEAGHAGRAEFSAAPPMKPEPAQPDKEDRRGADHASAENREVVELRLELPPPVGPFDGKAIRGGGNAHDGAVETARRPRDTKESSAKDREVAELRLELPPPVGPFDGKAIRDGSNAHGGALETAQRPRDTKDDARLSLAPSVASRNDAVADNEGPAESRRVVELRLELPPPVGPFDGKAVRDAGNARDGAIETARRPRDTKDAARPPQAPLAPTRSDAVVDKDGLADRELAELRFELPPPVGPFDAKGALDRNVEVEHPKRSASRVEGTKDADRQAPDHRDETVIAKRQGVVGDDATAVETRKSAEPLFDPPEPIKSADVTAALHKDVQRADEARLTGGGLARADDRSDAAEGAQQAASSDAASRAAALEARGPKLRDGAARAQVSADSNGDAAKPEIERDARQAAAPKVDLPPAARSLGERDAARGADEREAAPAQSQNDGADAGQGAAQADANEGLPLDAAKESVAGARSRGDQDSAQSAKSSPPGARNGRDERVEGARTRHVVRNQVALEEAPRDHRARDGGVTVQAKARARPGRPITLAARLAKSRGRIEERAVNLLREASRSRAYDVLDGSAAFDTIHVTVPRDRRR